MVPDKDAIENDTSKYPSLFAFEECEDNIFGETFALLSQKKILKGSADIINKYEGLVGHRNSE